MKARNNELPQGIPANLAELLKGDQQGYELRTGYSLELKHGLMPDFPALYKGTDNVVITFDHQLIHEVWKTLDPRRSQLDESQFYVNYQIGVCYPIFGSSKREMQESKPCVFLTKDEFTQLVAVDPHPFKWAPGLTGGYMGLDEFRQMLEASAREHGVDLP